jgi:hypothetical protein
VKSISNIVIGPLDCTVDPEQSATTTVTMNATGAHVCASEKNCGSDYLDLFECDLSLPHVYSEDDDPTRPEFYSCAFDIQGEVIGTSSDGGETTIGSLGVPVGQDFGCALFVDATQLEFVANPRLRITINNHGVLLGHEDYGPLVVTAEQPISCERFTRKLTPQDGIVCVNGSRLRGWTDSRTLSMGQVARIVREPCRPSPNSRISLR